MVVVGLIRLGCWLVLMHRPGAVMVHGISLIALSRFHHGMTLHHPLAHDVGHVCHPSHSRRISRGIIVGIAPAAPWLMAPWSCS